MSSQLADVLPCGPVFILKPSPALGFVVSTTCKPCEGVLDMKMPEKNPDLWAALIAWLSIHAPSVYAFLLSVTIAVVRVIYGGGTSRQMILEGIMCGLATLTLVPLLQVVGLPQSMATFAGGLVGFIGVEKLRDIAIRFGEKRAGL